jgi:hypothetical protein
MSAQEIASSLGNAKKVGGGYLASCPVPSHGQGNGDKHPSLSITMSMMATSYSSVMVGAISIQSSLPSKTWDSCQHYLIDLTTSTASSQ